MLFLWDRVAVENTARLHLDADLAVARLRRLPLDQFEGSPWVGYLYCAHRRLCRLRSLDELPPSAAAKTSSDASGGERAS
jgi:hypothetical protein